MRKIESPLWMTHDDVRRGTKTGELLLPSARLIARRLIDGWLDAYPLPCRPAPNQAFFSSRKPQQCLPRDRSRGKEERKRG